LWCFQSSSYKQVICIQTEHTWKVQLNMDTHCILTLQKLKSSNLWSPWFLLLGYDWGGSLESEKNTCILIKESCQFLQQTTSWTMFAWLIYTYGPCSGCSIVIICNVTFDFKPWKITMSSTPQHINFDPKSPLNIYAPKNTQGIH
jgi:hypothetical protein